MNLERWQEIKQKICTTFKVLDSYEVDLNPGTAEVIEFELAQGKVKAEFSRRPRIIDKTTLYSRRIGGDVKVSYQYAPDEEVYHLSVYRWNEHSETWERLKDDAVF